MFVQRKDFNDVMSNYLYVTITRPKMFVYDSFRTCRKQGFSLVTVMDVRTISDCRTCIGWPKTCVNTSF